MKDVEFPVSAEVAYDYLVDPANRAEWQSSLRTVEDVRGPDDVVGQSWTDVTVPGLRPRMELTEASRPHRWSERGTWRSVEADLTLTFSPRGPDACAVGVTMGLRARGLLGLPMRVVDRAAPYAVASDLRRAAKILGRARA